MQFKPCRILAALALLLLPGVAVAQNPSTISGTVTREDGTPLPGATIAIPTLSVGGNGPRVMGATSCWCRQRQVKGQEVTLSVRAIGYKPESRRGHHFPRRPDTRFHLAPRTRFSWVRWWSPAPVRKAK
jgi:hypothetical protein